MITHSRHKQPPKGIEQDQRSSSETLARRHRRSSAKSLTPSTTVEAAGTYKNCTQGGCRCWPTTRLAPSSMEITNARGEVSGSCWRSCQHEPSICKSVTQSTLPWTISGWIPHRITQGATTRAMEHVKGASGQKRYLHTQWGRGAALPSQKTTKKEEVRGDAPARWTIPIDIVDTSTSKPNKPCGRRLSIQKAFLPRCHMSTTTAPATLNYSTQS
jgi:hypothetical protein